MEKIARERGEESHVKFGSFCRPFWVLAFLLFFILFSAAYAAAPQQLPFEKKDTPLLRLAAPYLLRLLPCLLLGIAAGVATVKTEDEEQKSKKEEGVPPSASKQSSQAEASSSAPAEGAEAATSTGDTLVYGKAPLPPTLVDMPAAPPPELAAEAPPAKEEASELPCAEMLETFQQALLHDFINRLRNRFPDEPERFLARLLRPQMTKDLRDYVERLIPKHAKALAQRPGAHGLAELLEAWAAKLALLESFLEWAGEMEGAESSPDDCRIWTTKLGELVTYLEKLQAAIIAFVGDFTLDLADLLDEVDALYPEVRLDVGFALTVRHEGGETVHDELKAVFTNLCDNALNAGAKQIVIKAKRNKGSGFIDVSVSDDGAGLPDPSASHLFLTGVGLGSGTGLSKVRKIVQRLGGTVAVGEPVDGAGAHFELNLPRKVEVSS
mgnify:CR=1 FL=1